MSGFDKHIVVVGTARSGTSWLSETMARQHRYRMLFEPEHETKTQKGHLVCDQWISPVEDTETVKRYLHHVFKNQVDCDWIAQNSNRTLKMHLWPFIPKKYIIKFVRANLSARYMNTVFKIPVIHIIRNPYDVIRSQQQSNFPWLLDLSIFASQDHLVDVIQETFNYDISLYKTLSDVEKLCLRWCIENVIPLEVLKGYQHKSAIVKYEDLVADIQVYYDLCDTFAITPVENLKTHYRRPSSKTHPESDLIKSTNSTKTLTAALDKAKINELLDIFETQLYPRE